MDKRRISRAEFSFLNRELTYYRDQGYLEEEEVEEIIKGYHVGPGFSFLKVVLATGAILVGLGVLTFIASNWQEISKLMRCLIILAALIGANLASYLLQESQPKTSRSLLYLATLIYGAGIFLIGQIFNFSGSFPGAFLLWAVGSLPAALLFRDRLLFVFVSVFLLVYLNGNLGEGAYPWWILPILPLLYWSLKFFTAKQLLLFFLNLVALNAIGVFAVVAEVNGLAVALIYFAIGLALQFLPALRSWPVFHIQGGLVSGIAGLFLTAPFVWETWDYIFRGVGYAEIFSIAFTVAFVIFLFYLTKREDIIALIFICATIFRFYFDLTYNFLPKSVFFLLSGFLLLGFGFYIERQIKKKGGAGHDE